MGIVTTNNDTNLGYNTDDDNRRLWIISSESKKDVASNLKTVLSNITLKSYLRFRELK